MSGALLDNILAFTLDEVSDDKVIVFFTKFKCIEELDGGCSIEVGYNSTTNGTKFEFDCYLAFFPGKSMDKIIELLIKKYGYF